MENNNLGQGRCGGIARNWWVPLLSGIIFMGIGILVFFRPESTYLALALIFGAMVIISGILEIYIGALAPRYTGRGWIIAGGIVELLLGIVMLALPQVSMAVLPFLLGFWLMVRGFSLIGKASDMMDDRIQGGGWTLALAIVLVICSFLVLLNPIIGAGAIIIWLGISLLIAGIAMIVSAVYLQRMRKC